ncbi:cytochrome P460 family protein [Thalassoglobus sp. JC818]|uniref:cytochrome P460 family protein n=1 Tax=Thalassoglobus sp. JC818 TaxID=3232136 RepID=UPI0034580632
MKKIYFAARVVICTLPLFSLGCGSATTVATQAEAADPQSAATRYAAAYNAEGELIRPSDHREWIFMGAPVTPNDMNDGMAAFPEFHNVYIDPVSYASYKKSGMFSDGTVILKELVSVGGKSMDSGNGYFQGEFISLEAMVKDRKRFEDEPGGWAFFRFGEAPNYEPTGARMKTESCNSCHSGANEDYVFTDTYPVLRAAKADLAK